MTNPNTKSPFTRYSPLTKMEIFQNSGKILFLKKLKQCTSRSNNSLLPFTKASWVKFKLLTDDQVSSDPQKYRNSSYRVCHSDSIDYLPSDLTRQRTGVFHIYCCSHSIKYHTNVNCPTRGFIYYCSFPLNRTLRHKV